MFDVLKGEGSLCFLEGPLGPSFLPNASTKLLYHLGKLKSLTNALLLNGPRRGSRMMCAKRQAVYVRACGPAGKAARIKALHLKNSTII